MATSTRNPRVRISGWNPHFFKVFFPNISSEHLKIPPKFREHIEGEKWQDFRYTVSLNARSGGTWYVDLVKNPHGIFFGDGWEKFVVDHSLSLGDFLVFRYDGKSRFTVFLFDDTACEKEDAFAAAPCRESLAEEEEEAAKGLVVARNGRVPVGRKRKRGVDCPELDGSWQKKRANVVVKKSLDRSTVRKSKSRPHYRQAANSQLLATHSPTISRETYKGCCRKDSPIGGKLSLRHKILGEKPMIKPRSVLAVNSQSLATHSPSSSRKTYQGRRRKESPIGGKLSLRHKILGEKPMIKPRSVLAVNSQSSATHSPSSSRKTYNGRSRKESQIGSKISLRHKILGEKPMIKPRSVLAVNSQSLATHSPSSSRKRYKGPSRKESQIGSKLLLRHKILGEKPMIKPRSVLAVNSQSLATHSPSSSRKTYKCPSRKESQIGSKLLVRHKTLGEKPMIKSRSVLVSKTTARSTTSIARSSIEKSNKSSGTSALIRSRKMPSKAVPAISSSQMLQLGEVCKVQQPRGVISRRRPITEEELDKAREMSQSFQSEHPFWITEMTESYVYHGFFLHIPRSFVREHFPDGRIKMTLWDPNEKPWEVMYIFYEQRGGYFSGGWGKFARANNLEMGDICIFELLKEYHLKVHVFRVVEEITPLIMYWEAES